MSFLLMTSVLGYVISCGNVYAFHVVLAFYYFFVFIGFISIKTYALKAMLTPLVFLGFVVVSLLWAPDLTNGLSYILYFIFGYSIMFAVVNFADDIERLEFVFKVAALFFLLNILVGLLESTGQFRLPSSAYVGSFSRRPSGFNWNLNNFGFVFIAILPFLFLYPNRFLRILFFFVSVWFLIKLQSKGFFLGFFAFFVFYSVFKLRNKSTLCGIAVVVTVAVCFVTADSLSFWTLNFNNRAFSAFSQIERGVGLALSDEVVGDDSTAIRLQMYLFGLQELISSNGLGVGVAGIGSMLAQQKELFGGGHQIVSFHNFFLEMLVDIGVIPFVVVIVAYVRLALENIKYSKYFPNKRLGYFGEASGLALLSMLPASISPSSIIYVLTFWMVLGFSLAVCLVSRRNLRDAIN